MIHPLKVTGTLADETRYLIYEYMLKQKKSFTVQEIADQFNIHPNVARLHLTKLSEINVISAEFVKTGKGGRPGRTYIASEQGVVLSFPKREDEHLIKWTLTLIEQIGPSAIEAAKKISYDDGYNKIISQYASVKNLPFGEKKAILENTAALIGYIPKITETQNGNQLIFSIYNCPFKKHLIENSEIVCTLHESYIKGQIDALFENNQLIQFESMVHNCDLCQYEITVTNRVL